jgi:hypothetical protein
MQKSNRKDEEGIGQVKGELKAFVDFNCSPKRYEVIVTPRSRGISGRTMMGKPQFQALPSSFSKKSHEIPRTRSRRGP